jgi:cell division ATPase FtsA
LVELAKEQLRLPVALGYPLGLQSITDKISDPSFAPAIGLVRWGARLAGTQRRSRPAYNVAGKVADRLHKVFKSLVP